MGSASDIDLESQPGPVPAPDEPRTETTLTTRVRINIPGSRPIPEVVVRTPVEDGESTGSIPRPPVPPGADAVSAQLPSGWTSGGAAGAVPSGPAPVPTPTPMPPSGPEAPAAEGESGGKPASDWFAPRKASAPGAGELGSAESTQQFRAPQIPQRGQGMGVTQPIRVADPSGGATPDGAAPGGATPGGPAGGPTARDPFAGTGVSAGRPSGSTPFGQPARGAGPVPGQDSPFGGPGAPGGPAGAAPRGTFGDGVPFPAYQPPAGPTGPMAASGPSGASPPAGPTSGPVTGAMQIPPAGTPARSGFRPPTPFAGTAPPPGGRVSGDTLVSSVPTAPQAGNRAPEPAVGSDSYRLDEDDDKPAKKKGRSKLLLLAVALVGAVGIAYGAGLATDHADVPKGTTVLGVDIGGKSKDEAVKTLDTALKTRITAPLNLQVGDRTQQLKPAVAGLTIDTRSTVGNIAHTDYNPVSVIGGLFGGTRAAEPAVSVDHDKLKAALQDLADGSGGSATEGSVKFVAGQAVGVPGESYTALDIDDSVEKVEAAYRQRAATGTDKAVALSVTTQKPKVTEAEIERAIADFGDVAMSGLVTVQTDAVHSISFSPEKSIPKFLSMKVGTNGKLEPYFDLDVLKALYGSVFDGVLLERGNGNNTAVTPQDVAGVLLTVLRGTTPAERIGVIENVAQ